MGKFFRGQTKGVLTIRLLSKPVFFPCSPRSQEHGMSERVLPWPVLHENLESCQDIKKVHINNKAYLISSTSPSMCMPIFVGNLDKT